MTTNTDKKVRYFTFGVDHPYAKMILKIISGDPRSVMIDIFGSNWAWEYLPERDTIIENDDGTVTIRGRHSDYTYKMLPVIEN